MDRMLTEPNSVKSECGLICCTSTPEKFDNFFPAQLITAVKIEFGLGRYPPLKRPFLT